MIANLKHAIDTLTKESIYLNTEKNAAEARLRDITSKEFNQDAIVKCATQIASLSRRIEETDSGIELLRHTPTGIICEEESHA